MSSAPQRARAKVVYPDCDGKPIAENTLQYEWVVTIKGNLDLLFRDRADVFVAGDLLWYPVEGSPKICTAPDAMVAFGRPKGHRPSYKQWEEGNIPPQVVFEVLSHRNRPPEMRAKLGFYERHGVQEYYIYDPQKDALWGYQRNGEEQVATPGALMDGWVSPLLGVRFNCSETPMRIEYPDGSPFLTLDEIAAQRDAFARARNLAERERDLAARERDLAAHERDLAAHERDLMARELENERERAARMAAKLREMGIEP
jgi:Uma2 family endonuclease